MLKTKKHNTGFTLIEIIASITIFAIIVAVVFSILGNATNNYFTTSERTRLHTELSIAMDRMFNDISLIPLNGTRSTIAPNITYLNSTRINWIDHQRNACELNLTGSNLMLTEGGNPVAVLLTNVTSVQFSAFDQTNNPLSSTLTGNACDPIRRITITVTVQNNGVSEMLRTKIFIRSTRLGPLL